jgi:hypothetical protein
MAALLPPALFQAIDADGHPYAGGTLLTYIPATTTPKATWSNPAGTSLNTNPVVLDSAGRALIYGDGLYRTILKDSAGNLIWDQPSSTLVSLAMAPVILAPTIADAVALLGIQALIDASVEAAARAAADAAEAATRLANDTTLLNALNAEIARAEAAEANLQAQISGIVGATGPVQTRHGTLHTDPVTAVWTIAFSPAFPTACLTVQAHGMAANPELYYVTLDDTSGFPTLPSTTAATGRGWGLTGGAGAPPEPALDLDFAWIATGY